MMLLPIAKLTSGLATVVTTAVARNANTFHNVVGGVSTNMIASPAMIASVVAKSITANNSMSSSILPLLHNLRGGAAAAAGVAIDFQREGFVLQGMATYGTITALVMNAALRLFTSTKFSKDQHKLVSNTFNIATSLCVMSGAFTAILFQLLVIYSKGALGMVHDTGYLQFKAATSAFRMWGFRCLLIEVISFLVSFLMSLYNTLWTDAREHRGQKGLTKTGTGIMIGSVLLMLIGSYQIHVVLNLATKYIFSASPNMYIV